MRTVLLGAPHTLKPLFFQSTLWFCNCQVKGDVASIRHYFGFILRLGEPSSSTFSIQPAIMSDQIQRILNLPEDGMQFLLPIS